LVQRWIWGYADERAKVDMGGDLSPSSVHLLGGARRPRGGTTLDFGRVARTFSLNETGRLHLTSHHGFTLNEQGSATGTIYIHLKIVSTNRVTAEVNIYPRNGSLTGFASASYCPAGATATFNGTISIARGSGSYSHARGSGLAFTGAIQRGRGVFGSTEREPVRVVGGDVHRRQGGWATIRSRSRAVRCTSPLRMVAGSLGRRS
jgi:hypothetical protein